MTIYFKSRGAGCNIVHKLIDVQAKIDKFKFCLCDCSQIHDQIGYMGQFVNTLCNSLYWYHTKASGPLIKKVGAQDAT